MKRCHPDRGPPNHDYRTDLQLLHVEGVGWYQGLIYLSVQPPESTINGSDRRFNLPTASSQTGNVRFHACCANAPQPEIVHRSVWLRLLPGSCATAQQLASAAGAGRKVWNYFLDRTQQEYAAYKAGQQAVAPSLTFFSLGKESRPSGGIRSTRGYRSTALPQCATA